MVLAFEETAVVSYKDSVFEDAVVTEELASEETAAGDETASSQKGIEGLVYTGEPQELITAQPGDWLYSLDGETYTKELPKGVNAGEYTVYMKEGEAEPVVITVSIAKADVIFTPPEANTTIQTTNEAAPADEAGDENEAAEGVAYSAGEEPTYVGEEPTYADEVVFEE